MSFNNFSTSVKASNGNVAKADEKTNAAPSADKPSVASKDKPEPVSTQSKP